MVQAGIVSPDTPFIGEQPNKNISLCMYGDSTGLRVWNDKNDPMPIKTTNMAGLQKWEETEDYIIYLCKDATMTTVQNYVTGTFQEFQERKAQIEANQEIMRSYSIEWTEQDSIDLINDINKRALTNLALKPTILDLEETPNEIQVLSSRAVPVTYECCFRMDKKSGEFYIGEGYENFSENPTKFGTVRGATILKVSEKEITIRQDVPDGYIDRISKVGHIFTDERLQVSYTLSNTTYETSVRSECFVFSGEGVAKKKATGVWSKDYRLSFEINKTEWGINFDYRNIRIDAPEVQSSVGKEITLGNFQITKTHISKPFVKSVMPSGKLAFITNATSDTHSFVMKGVKSNLELGASTYIYVCGSDFSYERATVGNNFEGDCLISKNFNNVSFVGSSGVTQGQVRLTTIKWNKDYFTQLLIYKANLTETELKGELAKDIKLNDGYNDYFNIRRKL